MFVISIKFVIRMLAIASFLCTMIACGTNRGDEINLSKNVGTLLSKLIQFNINETF